MAVAATRSLYDRDHITVHGCRRGAGPADHCGVPRRVVVMYALHHHLSDISGVVVGVQLPPQQQTWNGGIHEEEEMKRTKLEEMLCWAEAQIRIVLADMRDMNIIW